MIFLDTDVLIDCLRGSAAAREWLQRAGGEPCAIPGVAAMELIMGCRNKAELGQVQDFLGRFSIIWPEPAEFAQAYELLVTHKLDSGLGIPDCLIAATCVQRGARLYSFNLKHFQVVRNLIAENPYSRL